MSNTLKAGNHSPFIVMGVFRERRLFLFILSNMDNLFKVQASVNDETVFVHLLFFTFYSEAIKDLKMREIFMKFIHLLSAFHSWFCLNFLLRKENK